MWTLFFFFKQMCVQPWNTSLQLVLLFPHRSLSAFACILLKKKNNNRTCLSSWSKCCLFSPPCFHNSKNGNGFCFSFPNKKKFASTVSNYSENQGWLFQSNSPLFLLLKALVSTNCTQTSCSCLFGKLLSCPQAMHAHQHSVHQRQLKLHP